MGWSIKNSPGTLEPTNAYIPPGGFSKWSAALQGAVAGGAPAVAWGYGASIVAGGTQVTDMLTKPYFALWRQTKINQGYAVHGDTMQPTYSANFNSAVTYSAVPFTFDVNPQSWSAAVTAGPGFLAPWPVPTWSTATTNPLVHYIHPSTALGYNARSLRIFYYDAVGLVGRTWTAIETVDSVTHNVTDLGDGLIHFVDFTNLSDAPNHRLNIGNQGAASIAVCPIAVASYPTTTIPSTGGIHYGWFGVPGNYSLSDIGYSGAVPADRIAQLIGPSNASAPFTPAANLSPPFGPNLVFIDVFDDMTAVLPNGPANSASTPAFTVTGGSPSVVLQHLSRVVQSFRRKVDANNKSVTDIVHHIPNFPDGNVSDTVPGATYQLWNAWEYYMGMKYLAELMGNGWLNTDAEWGEMGLALTFLNAGNPHPTNAGHLDIANRIASRLGL